MRFAFTDDQLAIAAATDAFLAKAASSEATRVAMADGSGLDRPLWHALARDLGVTGIAVPEAYGGLELGMVESAIIAEALGRTVSAVPWLSSAVVAASAITRSTATALRERWLPELAGGTAIATFAVGDIRVRNGLLDGVAAFVPHGGIADLFIVHVGHATYLVPSRTSGITLITQQTMDQTRPLARLILKGVAADQLAAMDWTDIEARAWTAIAADALGGAQACLDRTVAYVQERVQFGRPIGSFQAVKHRLADMLVGVEQARSAVFWAAGEIDARSADARFAAHAAKSFACDVYAECAGHAIQLHGGIGFTWEHDAHLFLKRARANLSLMGAPRWHRQQIARIMGLGASCN